MDVSRETSTKADKNVRVVRERVYVEWRSEFRSPLLFCMEGTRVGEKDGRMKHSGGMRSAQSQGDPVGAQQGMRPISATRGMAPETGSGGAEGG